jgi:hypothetical protein
MKKYWVWAVAAVPVLVSGGAIGGASGAVVGYLAQKIVDRRPSMPIWAKIAIAVTGTVLGFVIYLVILAVLMAVFPGIRDLMNRQRAPAP